MLQAFEPLIFAIITGIHAHQETMNVQFVHIFAKQEVLDNDHECQKLFKIELVLVPSLSFHHYSFYEKSQIPFVDTPQSNDQTFITSGGYIQNPK